MVDQEARENENEKIFKGLNIFVEIFNNGINQSFHFTTILEKHGANVSTSF
jgi:hypothetical protein